jgi:putative acetyltransferase
MSSIGLSNPPAAAPAWPIRRATCSDVETLRAIRRAAIEAVGQPYYQQRQRAAWLALMSDSLKRVVEAPGQIVIVAECESRQHGFAWVAIEARTHLYALYVHPQSGGRGIGTALLAAAEHLASQRGVTRLFVAASRNAVGFYARLGYAAEREFVLHHHDEQGAISLPMCKMSKPLG